MNCCFSYETMVKLTDNITIWFRDIFQQIQKQPQYQAKVRHEQKHL